MPTIRLNVSSVCNFSCRYCHVFRVAPKRKLPPLMPLGMMRFAVGTYLDMARSQGKTIVSIYGGEPLLNRKSVFSLISGFAKTHNELSWIINTNGSLLTESDAIFFRKHDVDVHLSLDGPAHVHNANRVDKQGKPTFARVRKALETIGRHRPRAQINSFAFPGNDLKGIVTLGKSHGITRFYMDYAYLEQAEHSAEIFVEFLKECIENSCTVSGPWLQALKGRGTAWLPLVDVDADSTFHAGHPLADRLPLSEFRQPVLESENAKGLKTRKALMDSHCRYCFLKGTCNAGILYLYWYHTRSAGWPNSYCQLTRKIAKRIATRIR